MSLDGPFGMHVLPFCSEFGHTWCNCPKKFFGIELLLFEKNEMEQKLNFNHNALTIEQLLQSRSNCSIVRAIGQFVHTARCMFTMYERLNFLQLGPLCVEENILPLTSGTYQSLFDEPSTLCSTSSTVCSQV